MTVVDPYAIPTDGKIQHKETLDCLAELTQSPMYVDMARSEEIRRRLEEGGAMPVPTLLDITAREQREEARAEGREEGREEGELAGMVRVYSQTLGYPPERIAKELGKPVDVINKVIEQL